MNAAKAREQYQVALRLMSELRAVPFDSERSGHKLALLSGLVNSIQRIANAIPDKDSNAIWQQRTAALHKDLVALTCHLAQDGGQMWDGVVRVLYLGAETIEKLEQEKEALMARLAAETEHRQQLERTLQEQVLLKDTAANEILELRTKFVVQQQDFQRRDADARDLVRRLQLTVRERDALNSEKEYLDEKNSHSMQILERQGEAIAQLMSQVEDNTKQKEEALASLTRINQDNHTLRVNLGQHAQVIENLIEMNAEMMEAANNYATVQEQTKVSTLEREDVNDGAKATVAIAAEPEVLDSHAPTDECSVTQLIVPRTEGLMIEAMPNFCNQASPFTIEKQADVDSPEKPRRRDVRWSSDMLPLSFKDKKDMNTPDKDDTAIVHTSFGTTGLLGKLGGVGGKAKGFLSFVAGADLAGNEDLSSQRV